MPDNDDLRMNQNETLNCKLALMGVWTEACREAAAYFGVNPDGSGNFSSVTQAQAGSTAGTLAVDGISADEMTSRLAASLVEHFPDKTDIITGDPAAAKAYVKQYVVDLANHQALAQARTNSKLFHKQLISRQISEGRLDIGEIARAFVGAMGRKTGAALDAALEGKHAGCYSRDVDALVFTDDDIDDYANMIEHGRPDLDFIQCREIASQAVTDWNDGHAMDGFTEFLYDYADEHAPAESVKQGGGIRH